MSGSKFTDEICETPKNAVATAFRKPETSQKRMNLHFNLSIKHLITLEIVINSLSGKIF